MRYRRGYRRVRGESRGRQLGSEKPKVFRESGAVPLEGLVLVGLVLVRGPEGRDLGAGVLGQDLRLLHETLEARDGRGELRLQGREVRAEGGACRLEDSSIAERRVRRGKLRGQREERGLHVLGGEGPVLAVPVVEVAVHVHREVAQARVEGVHQREALVEVPLQGSREGLKLGTCRPLIRKECGARR
jgi:hypothetical protein